MSLMRESDPRFANLERKVGIFLLVCLVAIAAALLSAAARQGLFRAKATLTFHDESGRDLAAGMQVVTRGFVIGSVSRVRLDDTGLVEVRLAIDRDYLRWIRRDSTARMLPKVIGGGRIEISPGTPTEPPMADGDTIVFVREPELIDVAKRIMEDVKPVLLSVRSLIEYLDDPQGDVKTAIANVNRLTAGLIETQAGLDRTVADVNARVVTLLGNIERTTAAVNEQLIPQVQGLVARGDGVLASAGSTAAEVDRLVREDLRGLLAAIDGELLPQVRGLLAAAGSGVEGANRMVGTVDARLPELLAQVEATLANVRRITDNLVPVSAEAGGLVRQGQTLLDESGALLRRTQEIWPFRGAPARERKVDVDSYRSPQGAPRGDAPDARGVR